MKNLSVYMFDLVTFKQNVITVSSCENVRLLIDDVMTLFFFFNKLSCTSHNMEENI